jgi:hypothetical protein
LGIWEFFIDSVSYNPNDEFGVNSLYLCSSIESSFGYTYTNDAKLVDFTELWHASEIESKLKHRHCKSDSDCIYNDFCTTICDVKRNVCTYKLNRPQIGNACNFLYDYLSDNTNITVLLKLFDDCKKLSNDLSLMSSDFYNNANSLNSIPSKDIFLSFENYKHHLKTQLFNNLTMEYTRITNGIQQQLWQHIQFAKDPIKKKKKKKKTTTPPVASSKSPINN